MRLAYHGRRVSGAQDLARVAHMSGLIRRLNGKVYRTGLQAVSP